MEQSTPANTAYLTAPSIGESPAEPLWKISYDRTQQLLEAYPDLFSKDVHSIDCGDGWFNILDQLFRSYMSEVLRCERELHRACTQQDAYEITNATALLAQARRKAPLICQVKEKWGSLNIYFDRVTIEQDNLAYFCINLSQVTCERCGSPGHMRDTKWVRVLCDNCYELRYNK